MRRTASLNCRRPISAVALAAALTTLAACGGPGVISAPSVATYMRSNAFVLAGYSEKTIDDTHYEVRANGTAGTPRARVEKIAMARAAEIGVEGKLRYFKVAGVRHGVQCGKKQEIYKGTPQKALHYPTVMLDVQYAKGNAPPDASWQVAADSHAKLLAELKGEAVVAEDAVAASEEIKAQCP